MENLSRNTHGALPGRITKRTKIEHTDCKIVKKDKKVVLSKKTEKTYRVTVTYVQISDDEARMKRSIIENIIKKGYRTCS